MHDRGTATSDGGSATARVHCPTCHWPEDACGGAARGQVDGVPIASVGVAPARLAPTAYADVVERFTEVDARELLWWRAVFAPRFGVDRGLPTVHSSLTSHRLFVCDVHPIHGHLRVFGR